MAHNYPERGKEGLNATSLTDLVREKFLPPSQEVEAVLVVGSTALKSRVEDWDDFDLQIYTQSKPEWESHYEILNVSGRHYLVSAYYIQLDPTSNPEPTVMEQNDVRILLGSYESLRHIRVDRPSRIEPLPHELRRFERHYEVFFNILVDIFFILNRYEAKGRPYATKPRVARDGLRTISRHFYRFYGVNRGQSIPKNARWKGIMWDTVSLLQERGFASICQNGKFAEAAIDLILARLR